jgi:hypothetical protein
MHAYTKHFAAFFKPRLPRSLTPDAISATQSRRARPRRTVCFASSAASTTHVFPLVTPSLNDTHIREARCRRRACRTGSAGLAQAEHGGGGLRGVQRCRQPAGKACARRGRQAAPLRARRPGRRLRLRAKLMSRIGKASRETSCALEASSTAGRNAAYRVRSLPAMLCQHRM